MGDHEWLRTDRDGNIIPCFRGEEPSDPEVVGVPTFASTRKAAPTVPSGWYLPFLAWGLIVFFLGTIAMVLVGGIDRAYTHTFWAPPGQVDYRTFAVQLASWIAGCVVVSGMVLAALGAPNCGEYFAVPLALLVCWLPTLAQLPIPKVERPPPAAQGRPPVRPAPVPQETASFASRLGTVVAGFLFHGYIAFAAYSLGRTYLGQALVVCALASALALALFLTTPPGEGVYGLAIAVLFLLCTIVQLILIGQFLSWLFRLPRRAAST